MPDQPIKPVSPAPSAELPIVKEGVFAALEHDRAGDEQFADHKFRDLNNRNHVLATHIILEAHRQSGGDVERQESFVNGAVYVFDALRRQTDVNAVSELVGESATVLEFPEPPEDTLPPAA